MLRSRCARSYLCDCDVASIIVGDNRLALFLASDFVRLLLDIEFDNFNCLGLLPSCIHHTSLGACTAWLACRCACISQSDFSDTCLSRFDLVTPIHVAHAVFI